MTNGWDLKSNSDGNSHETRLWLGLYKITWRCMGFGVRVLGLPNQWKHKWTIAWKQVGVQRD